MYAVIKIGGNQYKVKPGESFDVSHLEGEVGQVVSFPALLVVDGGQVKVGKEAEKVQVKTKIVGSRKGDKLDVYRFQAKSRHRRHIGFRPSLTTLVVETIGETKKAEAAKPVPKKQEKPITTRRATKTRTKSTKL